LKVLRIVADFGAEDPGAARAFYADLLGLDVAMDQGWILTFAGSEGLARPQLSVMREGGSGAPVPDLSVEVDDLAEAERRVRAAGVPLEYGPVDEPWGVRRFFVRDPMGRLINVLAHV